MKILAELDVKMGKLKEKSSLVKLEMPIFLVMFEEISGGGGGPVDFGQQRGDDPVSTCTRKAIRVIPVGLLVRKEGSRAA